MVKGQQKSSPEEGGRVKLAISGKGGVGKNTIAAGLIKHFAWQGYQVYAVDADADSSPGMVLGFSEERPGT